MITTIIILFMLGCIIAYGLYAYKSYKYSIALYQRAKNLNLYIMDTQVKLSKMVTPDDKARLLLAQANEQYEEAREALDLNFLYKANEDLNLGYRLVDNAIYYMFMDMKNQAAQK